MHGYGGSILTADLSTGECQREDSAPFAGDWIGGRMLAARLAWERIPSGTGPWDPENALIAAAGPLAGTLSPSSGRTVLSGISPVPHPVPWYTHSTLGGWFAGALKFAGLDALVIRGRASVLSVLEVRDGNAKIRPCPELAGLDAVEVQEALKAALGPDAQVLCVGPAGENRVRSATVQHDFECAAGHSGFGAVFGAKNLKAVAILGRGGVDVARPEDLFSAWRSLGPYRMNPEHKFLSYERSRDRPGPEAARPVCSQACVNDCRIAYRARTRAGGSVGTFCLGPVFEGDGIPAEYSRPNPRGIAVPSLANLPPGERSALVEDMNRLGLDYWVRVTVHAFLAAAEAAGVRSLAGFMLPPDISSGIGGILTDLAHRRGLGGLFSDGLAVFLDRYGDALPASLAALGRELIFAFGFQAHREGRFWDREPLPYWIFSAMLYATESRDPTIGTHSLMHLAEIQLARGPEALAKFRTLSERLWGRPNVLEPDFDFEAKALGALWARRARMVIDSLPLCDFAFPRLLKSFDALEDWSSEPDVQGDLDLDLRLLEAVTGIRRSREDLDRAADRASALERLMILRSGRNRALERSLASHFGLPCREDGTALHPGDWERMMDAWLAVCRYDPETGAPTPELLAELGISVPPGPLTFPR